MKKSKMKCLLKPLQRLTFLLKFISLVLSSLFFQLALDQTNTLCSVRNKENHFL